jgi:hypothetical protein
MFLSITAAGCARNLGALDDWVKAEEGVHVLGGPFKNRRNEFLRNMLEVAA